MSWVRVCSVRVFEEVDADCADSATSSAVFPFFTIFTKIAISLSL